MELPVRIFKRRIGDREVTSIGGFTSDAELDFLRQLTANLAKDRYVRALEIGSWVGESAVAICQGFGDNGHLTCVDHFLGSETDASRDVAKKIGDIRGWFDKNTEGLPITVMGMTSEEAFNKVFHSTDLQYDFCFIDAGHSFSEAYQDIDRWVSFMSNGSVLCGHDYSSVFPGVVAAVNQHFVAEDELRAGTEPYVMPNGSIWILTGEEYAPKEAT